MLKYLFLLLFGVSFCYGAGYFTVIGSRSLQIGQKYGVHVNYRGYETNTTLMVTLVNSAGTEDDLEVILKGTGEKTVEFNVSMIAIQHLPLMAIFFS